MSESPELLISNQLFSTVNSMYLLSRLLQYEISRPNINQFSQSINQAEIRF